MSDELRRRFRDKIQGRPVSARRIAPRHDAEAGEPSSPFRIRALDHGPFPEADHINGSFTPASTRVRLTLDLAEEICGSRSSLGAVDLDQLLQICPSLPEHACADPASLPIPRGGDPAHGPAGGSSNDSDPGGMEVAHLIEHVAIDLLAAASGSNRCSGAACVYRHLPGRFDLFLEGADPMLGRAMAILATATVRDLVLEADRMAIHRRCRDLLVVLAAGGRRQIVAEDVAENLGWPVSDALETLEAVARLGYLEPLPGPFTFSSTTGTIFRRIAADQAFRDPAPPGRSPSPR